MKESYGKQNPSRAAGGEDCFRCQEPSNPLLRPQPTQSDPNIC